MHVGGIDRLVSSFLYPNQYVLDLFHSSVAVSYTKTKVTLLLQ